MAGSTGNITGQVGHHIYIYIYIYIFHPRYLHNDIFRYLTMFHVAILPVLLVVTGCNSATGQVQHLGFYSYLPLV